MTAKHIIQNSKLIILALGAEFDTQLALYYNNKIYFSKNTEEIAENPQNLEKFILNFLSQQKIIPNIIIADLHPKYNSVQIGKNLAKRFNANFFQVQHHLAHIFTAIGDRIMHHESLAMNYEKIIGIACDGTGYGIDKNIWGGEVFYGEKRIGHLEEQLLIGSELAIKEPARILISILAKFLSKEEIYHYTKKYYFKNIFEILFNQMKQNFNCQYTTSSARILDAVSLLLQFCKNERKCKHYPIKLLEKNSLNTEKRLLPKIKKEKNIYILKTTYLIKYLIENIHNISKNELAYLSQLYIIEGLYDIAKKYSDKKTNIPIFLGGGMANNKIFKKFATENNIYISEKISCEDKGIAFGQIIYYLLTNSRNKSSFRNIQFFFS